MDTNLTAQQAEQVHAPIDPWSDAFAKNIVMRDWGTAEAYRNQNHDWRYRTADELYLAWVQQKYWEGTRYPRSSIGVFTAFQQIESLMPHVMAALFGDVYMCDAEGQPGTTADQARSVRDLVNWQLENLPPMRPGKRDKTREIVRRAVKSGLVYGNGIVEVGWKYAKQQRRKAFALYRPETQMAFHPLIGAMQAPTGKMVRSIHETTDEEIINQPYLKYISIKDYYIDPNCPSPIVQDGRYDIVRGLLTVDEIAALRGADGFDIPGDDELSRLARNHPSTQGDVTKSASEIYRNMYYQPGNDSTADPAGKRIEVLLYTTADRIVWLANREKVFYNKANPYGFINHFNAFYTDVLDRFYGLAITDVVEGEQRLQQAIINGRVDELALALHPPTNKKRGTSIPAYQMRRRPGLVAEMDNPQTDLVREQVQNVTQQAFIETDASERRAQKITGVTDLAVLGTSSESGNSANRTATGVNAQSSATGRRIQYLVANIEDTFFEPILAAWLSMDQQFLDPASMLAILGEEGQQLQLDPLDVINANVKFKMTGSARLSSRQALQQSFPLVSQTILNPEFLQMLATQQQKTIDVGELGNILMDMTGYRTRNSLFRPMSQQELQAMQQPSQADQLKKQMADDRLNAQGDQMESGKMADMLKEILKAAAQKAYAVEPKGDSSKAGKTLQ